MYFYCDIAMGLKKKKTYSPANGSLYKGSRSSKTTNGFEQWSWVAQPKTTPPASLRLLGYNLDRWHAHSPKHFSEHHLGLLFYTRAAVVWLLTFPDNFPPRYIWTYLFFWFNTYLFFYFYLQGSLVWPELAILRKTLLCTINQSIPHPYVAVSFAVYLEESETKMPCYLA